jgi:phosphatidylinositol phospholipase C delta
MHSIEESRITKILDKSKDNAKLWQLYSVNHMTRTYPADLRVDSSYYNPVFTWAMGSQHVALNSKHQILIINNGRFRRNGGCGYILKPPSIMGKGSPSKMNGTISVLSAHCLPKPQGAKSGKLVDPYIKVKLCDAHEMVEGNEEYSAKSFKTHSLHNYSFCSVWTDTNFTFEVYNPDVAVLPSR